MRIQFASDLHLEFADNWRYLREQPLKVSGDILVLTGDIAYLDDNNYSKHPFWDWASENYSQVIVCMGNHEFYKFYDLAKLKDGYCMTIRQNVHCYYNAVVHIEDIDIIVSTLWSKIPLSEAYYTEQAVSDFRRILYNGELLTFSTFNREHEHCLTFLKDAVSKSKAKKKIFITHHVPSFLMQDPRFKESKANGAFTVELGEYIESSDIDYWIFGHSHYNVDVKIGNTLCLSNQLGYVFSGEHRTFDHAKAIDVS